MKDEWQVGSGQETVLCAVQVPKLTMVVSWVAYFLTYLLTTHKQVVNILAVKTALIYVHPLVGVGSLWQPKWGSSRKYNLVKFGYIIDMIVGKSQNPSIFLATLWKLSQDVANLGHSFPMKNPLYRSKSYFSGRNCKRNTYCVWHCKVDGYLNT